ncbi:MAG TPA: galactokinase [Chloroflexota bacterium]|nr:galactokinase [Chloroflexota bacterium]
MPATEELTEWRLAALLDDRFGARAGQTLIARAPGRVNLIGEHTDYNQGFVLPAAVDRAVLIAGRARPGRVISAYAGASDQFATWEPEGAKPDQRWMLYLAGVATALLERGAALPGVELAIAGDVPAGAGMSSSAALCVGAVLLFAALADFPVDGLTAARIAQWAETEYVGVRVGLMDPYASRNGKADHALLLDCRSQTHELVPLPAGLVLGVCDTGVRRALAGSGYNDRRRSCEDAVALLRPHVGGLRSLRDLDAEWLADLKLFLPETLYRRAHHVVTENQRTLEAAGVLQTGDMARMGALVRASHASLRDDYEVSSKELDAMAEAADAAPGCFGARMMGGGFGGCAIALVSASRWDEFAAATSTGYRERSGRAATIYRCRVTDGASLLPRG